METTSSREPATERDVERAKERLDEAVLNVAHAAQAYYDDEDPETRKDLGDALRAWRTASNDFLRAAGSL